MEKPILQEPLLLFYQTNQFLQQTTEFNYETLATRMRELSFLNKGITITLTDRRRTDDEGNFPTETFHSEEGLARIYQVFRFYPRAIDSNCHFYGR